MEHPTVASPAAPASAEQPTILTHTGRQKRPRNGDDRDSTWRSRPGSWLALGSFAVLGGSIWALINLTSWIDEENRDNLYIIAPLQVILGSAVFLASITCIVVVFGRLGLFDRSKALGLPEGSVRALLALILLIIFVIFANIVFGNLSGNVVRVRETFTGLTSTDIERLPGEVVERRPVVTTTVLGAPLPAPTFDGIYLEQRRDEDASALGQQIVTALITLVAAISAFYFGSGAVAAGTAAAASITSSSAPGGPKGTLFLRRPSLPASLTRDDAGNLDLRV